MQRTKLALSLLGFAALSACTDNDINVVHEPTKLVYAPSLGDIPVPNDLLFSGTVDATLNFPPALDAFGDPDTAAQGLFDALNSLDGWSTTAPITFHFDGDIDLATVVAGSTVRVFEVLNEISLTTGLRIGTVIEDVLNELTSPAQYVVEPTSTTDFVILPTSPLNPASAYMVVVTNGVLDAAGDPTSSDNEYTLGKVTDAYPAGHPFEGLQVLINAMEARVSTDIDVTGAPGGAIAAADIVTSFIFTTQDVLTVLGAARSVALGGEAAVLAAIDAATPPEFGHTAGTDSPLNTVPSAIVDTSSVADSPGTFADIYKGALTLPYYLTAAPNATAATVVENALPLTEFWHARYTFPFGIDTEANISRYNPLPLQSGAESIPMLITLPDPSTTALTMPAGGWPVVIFQHGITANRTSLLAIADILAGNGYAAVAIDLPLHGLQDAAADPFGGLLFAGYDEAAGSRERTFGLDNVTQDAFGSVTLADDDGVADSSGAHFINLSSLRTQRDNLRQAVADLFALKKVIGDGLDVDGLAGVDLDTANVHFVGMSLGAIVGTPFSALEPGLITATLNVPGGGIPRLLENSVSYGPTVLGGLAAFGISPGTPEFDQFMFAAQTTVDAGDPINFCAILGAVGPPVLLQEVVGDGSPLPPLGDLFGLPDQVIPNAVATAPLSGTEPMIAALGLTNVATGTVVTTGGAVRFSQGAHSSLLSPAPDVDGDGTPDADGTMTAANAEMQAQIIDWLNNAGTQVDISDDSVIQ
jgi:pimeloyl-ACP methyl ester carboxylesterase